jgi:nucleotide-binding universal stress UspA family protein
MATTHPVAVTFEHVMVPTDFSDVSQRALEYAKTLAKPGNSELLLAHDPYYCCNAPSTEEFVVCSAG